MLSSPIRSSVGTVILAACWGSKIALSTATRISRVSVWAAATRDGHEGCDRSALRSASIAIRRSRTSVSKTVSVCPPAPVRPGAARLREGERPPQGPPAASPRRERAGGRWRSGSPRRTGKASEGVRRSTSGPEVFATASTTTATSSNRSTRYTGASGVGTAASPVYRVDGGVRLQIGQQRAPGRVVPRTPCTSTSGRPTPGGPVGNLGWRSCERTLSMASSVRVISVLLSLWRLTSPRSLHGSPAREP